MLEDSRAGILAGKLVEGEKCPVCGSVHHPEPAKRKESSISEDEFKKLQEEETELQEEKNRANTEAEKAKTLLDEFEGQLGTTILECMKSPFLDMEGEKESLEELIGAVKEAKPQVETMSEECHQKCIVLEEDCGKLQKAEKDMEAARGDETEKLDSQKEELGKSRKKIEQEMTETQAILGTFEKLSFPNWKTAKRERSQAEAKKNKISEDITEAEEKKKKADSNVTAATSEWETLNGSLGQQEQDAEDLKKKLDKEVRANGFSSVEEMITYV